MNSLFSPFDAFCVESYGQKNFSFFFLSPNKEENQNGKGSCQSVLDCKEKKVRHEDSSPSRNNDGSTPPQKLQRWPRFAPELDGVHCFESIVPS